MHIANDGGIFVLDDAKKKKLKQVFGVRVQLAAVLRNLQTSLQPARSFVL